MAAFFSTKAQHAWPAALTERMLNAMSASTIAPVPSVAWTLAVPSANEHPIDPNVEGGSQHVTALMPSGANMKLPAIDVIGVVAASCVNNAKADIGVVVPGTGMLDHVAA